MALDIFVAITKVVPAVHPTRDVADLALNRHWWSVKHGVRKFAQRQLVLCRKPRLPFKAQQERKGGRHKITR